MARGELIGGTDGNDSLIGTAFDDTLSGGGGNDTLMGLAGNDLLVAGTGEDLLQGGDGNDAFFAAIELTAFFGPDTLDGGAGDDLFFVPGIGNDTPGKETALVIAGGPGTDMLFCAWTLGGTIDLAAGTMTADREPSSASLGGIESIYYIGGRVPSDFGSNVILVGDDQPNLIASETWCEMHGGGGNDTLIGSDTDVPYDFSPRPGGVALDEPGPEFGSIPITFRREAIYGDTGDDLVDARGGEDMVFGLEGNDTIFGGSGNDILYGDSLPFSLMAEPGGDDWLVGGDGNDALVGGLGNDYFWGGPGIDTYYGDTYYEHGGRDVYFFDSGFGPYDGIFDFNRADGDLLVIAAGINGTNITTAAQVVARAVTDGINLFIDLGAGEQVILAGITSLQTGDVLIA